MSESPGKAALPADFYSAFLNLIDKGIIRIASMRLDRRRYHHMYKES